MGHDLLNVVTFSDFTDQLNASLNLLFCIRGPPPGPPLLRDSELASLVGAVPVVRPAIVEPVLELQIAPVDQFNADGFGIMATHMPSSIAFLDHLESGAITIHNVVG
jgi:hypothetical protein